jgi:hypothetical protein
MAAQDFSSFDFVLTFQVFQVTEGDNKSVEILSSTIERDPGGLDSRQHVRLWNLRSSSDGSSSTYLR